jgi:hypothetical protein
MKQFTPFSLAFLLLACTTKNETATSVKFVVGEVTDLTKKTDQYWVQEHSIVVSGTIGEIWDLFTKDELMKTHVAPIIKVDFRNGGLWEASYDLQAKIGDSLNFVNEIVNIIPYRSITTRGVRAPFENEAMKSLRSTLSFEDLGSNQVRVTATTTGWEGITDLEYRSKVFDMAGSSNPEILRCLHARLTKGPLNWTEILANH